MCGSTDFDAVNDAGRDLLKKLNASTGEEVYSVRRARLGNDVRLAYFNAADGAVHPVKMLRLLQEQSHGVGFKFGVIARKVVNGRAELETSSGRHRVEYGRAFICTNAFAHELDVSSKVMPARGQVIVTSPVRSDTDRTLGYLSHGYDYFRFVDGRLLIGGGRNRFEATENGFSELRPTAELKAYLQEVARTVIGHGEFKVVHHWAGIMGFIGGSHLGGDPRRRLDDHTEIIAGFGGMGVALAPFYAHQIANE
jgi:gamma-glutamylputrescine oxidase